MKRDEEKKERKLSINEGKFVFFLLTLSPNLYMIKVQIAKGLNGKGKKLNILIG